MKKYIFKITLLIFIISMIILPVYAQSESSNMKAKIIKNNGIEEIEKENEPTKKVQNVTVRILEGEYEDEEYEMAYVLTEDIEDISSNLELKEEDNVLVEVEEKEGEVTNIKYIKSMNQNYTLYIVAAILIILLLIVSRKRAAIIYLVTILLVSYIFIFSMKEGWNLILTSSILSLIITLVVLFRANGMNKKTFVMIFSAILGISIAAILMNILFDVMGVTNINVKIAESMVNIKDLICSTIILFSCGICNTIIVVALNIYNYLNKPYKTKSDNIIEGQRSLKL